MTDWKMQKRRMAEDPEYAARKRAAAVRRTQKWRKRHPERYQELLREQAAKVKARRKTDAEFLADFRAKRRKYYAEHREEICRKWREMYRADEAYRLRKKASHAHEYERLLPKLESDAKLYAQWRAKRRMQRARKAVAEGRTYRPLYCTRFPDWAVKGQRVLDVSSEFLAVNMTPEQRAYALELAVERKERRAAR